MHKVAKSMGKGKANGKYLVSEELLQYAPMLERGALNHVKAVEKENEMLEFTSL
jgi:hypothetical protein